MREAGLRRKSREVDWHLRSKRRLAIKCREGHAGSEAGMMKPLKQGRLMSNHCWDWAKNIPAVRQILRVYLSSLAQRQAEDTPANHTDFGLLLPYPTPGARTNLQRDCTRKAPLHCAVAAVELAVLEAKDHCTEPRERAQAIRDGQKAFLINPRSQSLGKLSCC